MTELQTLLSLDKVLEDQSPIHVILMGHYNPIKLRPLGSEADLGEIWTKMDPITTPTVKALLAISFRGEELPKHERLRPVVKQSASSRCV